MHGALCAIVPVAFRRAGFQGWSYELRIGIFDNKKCRPDLGKSLLNQCKALIRLHLQHIIAQRICPVNKKLPKLLTKGIKYGILYPF